MVSGGRILNYVGNLIQDERVDILFSGYNARYHGISAIDKGALPTIY